MRQVMKIFLPTAAVLLGLAPSVLAYGLGGPIGNGGDAWQVATIGYDLAGDLNAPKNLGEEYRRNTPVMFYTYDQNFADYFGSSGIAAVDDAFTLLNTTFTNSAQGPVRGLDGYSAALSEFPLESRHINYQAQALGIFDMKSFTLGAMTEQLGLADPVRYAWTLHDRFLPAGGKCPGDEEYLVVQRNFDIISSPLDQLQYSAYVNNIPYDYEIFEACTGGDPLAVAEPFSLDPLADVYSPVASTAIDWGDYYSGLTRDDVAGLRYLLSSNNINYEAVSADSLLYTITTNTSGAEIFPPNATNFISLNGQGYYTYNGMYGYGDLAAFSAFIRTNGPAAVLAAYPGVVISSVSNSVMTVSNANIVAYYGPAPVGSPYGSPPTLIIKTNYTKAFEIIYNYTFANIWTNQPHFTTAGQQRLVTVTVGSPVGSPYGSPGVTTTNVSKLSYTAGDFFVQPPFYTNVCPIDILTQYGSIATVVAYTNLESIAVTNTALTNLSSTVYLITYFTNYSYIIDPVTCTATAGAAGLYQGIEKIQFVKVPLDNYDTLLGQFITPVTNNYTLNLFTNGQLVVQHLQRIVTQPDILMSAADLEAGPAGVPGGHTYARNLNFDQAHILPGLAGPGTITTPTTMTWNKVGPVYFNTPFGTMNGDTYFTANENPGSNLANEFYLVYFVYGSFDGSTNAPTVFANGASIDNLENQVLIQISPTSLADGTYNQAYAPVQFAASGGQLAPPLTWSASGLPDGLSLSPGGALSGTPQETGTFDFSVTIVDSNGLTVQWFYTILIL